MNSVLLNRSRSFFRAAVFLLLFLLSTASFRAQEVVDKTVATVSDSVKTELITYSDLLWQLALQPDAPIRPPNSADLNRALQTLINQRLIALEAQRLPSLAPSDAEVKAEITRVLNTFPSTAEFERRLRIVGFESVNDEDFERIMRQRVAIDKYLDFRFRSFVIITPDEETKYYQNIYTADFRKRRPGVLVPSLDEVRAQINSTLTETKIESDIAKYLEGAKRRADIEVLFEV